mmetsp:Transcript_50809/g.106169  ORF Transcript_50809/g.106169 Transcript_50809/m.106169 type:complete len:90 (-) Transcript_50809:140-409(-)
MGEMAECVFSNTHLHLPIHGALNLVGHLGGALVPIPGLVREKGLSASVAGEPAVLHGESIQLGQTLPEFLEHLPNNSNRSEIEFGPKVQ